MPFGPLVPPAPSYVIVPAARMISVSPATTSSCVSCQACVLETDFVLPVRPPPVTANAAMPFGPLVPPAPSYVIVPVATIVRPPPSCTSIPVLCHAASPDTATVVVCTGLLGDRTSQPARLTAAKRVQ